MGAGHTQVMPYLTRFSGRRECVACGVHTYEPGVCRNCGGRTMPTAECVGDRRPPLRYPVPPEYRPAAGPPARVAAVWAGPAVGPP